MATMVVQRPARRPSPELPSGELVLDPPPELPEPEGRQWRQALMFLPMMLIMAAMLLMFSSSMTGPLRFAIYGLFGVAMVLMIVVAFITSSGPSKKEMGHARRRYLCGLAQHRVRLLRSVHKQRDALVYLHPDPSSLWSLAASYRLWERRLADPDFAVIRVGTGPQSPATALIAPDTKPLEQLEPLSALALRRFLSTFSAIPDLPLAVALTGFGRLFLRGDRERVVGLVRAMLAQAAVMHAPDDLRIAVCADHRELATWDWVKWLPHALHPDKTDAAGPLRLVAPTVTGVEAMLDDLLSARPRFDPDGHRGAGPQLLVVLDGAASAGSDHLMSGPGVEGVTVIDLASAPPRTIERSALVLDIAENGALSTSMFDGHSELGAADMLALTEAEALARQLAPLRLTGGPRGEQPLSSDLGLADLLDLGDPYTFEPGETWVQRPNRERLRVTFGIQADGTPVEVDLKESAQDGMGPHGLLIGATGSGKSELLRTLVLSLAVTHPPNALNFALIDFKGGATFTRLDQLPHTSAVITNLADELPLVDRMTDALNGELIRRQELLRAAGNFSSLRDYERARAAGAPVPEVPSLLVICDEFSELLSAKPDFIDTFVQIGRVGRSLGVHLLLASQRLEEGRLRGLDTHLSYRVGLRTFSAMESRTVLSVPDAFELPRAPGHGYMAFGTDPLVRFRSAYVSGVHLRPDAVQPAATPQAVPELLEFTTDYLAPKVAEDESAQEQRSPEAADDLQGESLLEILVDRLAGRGTPAHQVWLPPLDDAVALDSLVGAPARYPHRGWCAPDEVRAGRLRAVAGVIDRPFEQRRDLLELDLSAGAGHLVIMGCPRSGKSTAVRTAIAGLALTNTPREAQFYVLDFGGGTLGALRGLPHVGGVAGRQNIGAVRRTVAQIASLLAERERRFSEHDVDSIAGYREARARGEFADDPYGDVFLVVDGWQTLRGEFEDIEETVRDLAARGLAYGVHLIVTCARLYDLAPSVRDLFGSKIELRLGDPVDSHAGRMAALNVPEDVPGRGVTQTKHQMLVALPRVDGADSDAALQEATADLVRNVADGWQAEPAPEVKLLPTTLPFTALPESDGQPGTGLRLTVGIGEHDLMPARLDFSADPHFLLFGDAQTGKTGFLRVLLRRITEAYTPDQARVIVIDQRRGLLGDATTEHVLGYGTDQSSTRRIISDTAAGLRERIPGEDVTPSQLRQRNWWSGPELFVLVDDYDLMAGQLDNPFEPLLGFLPQGHEIGLHVVLTRRTGGAGRALFEPFMARVRDVGSPGLLLSGDRDEGPLLGGRKPERLPAGRGRLVRRDGDPETVQLAWLPPAE